LAGPAANVGAWILRWSGRAEEADERNGRALEAAGGDDGPSADALAEAYYVALLDLADGCLLRGDLSEAAALVGRLAPLDSWAGTMAWHQRHRLGLLRARLALADGDGDTAAALALVVAEDAAGRGAGRYELLARAVAGLADPSNAAEQLSPVVDGLGRCAALDGWALVGALGSARKCDAWRRAAESMAAVVVAGAGSHAESAASFVESLLIG
jgi:hypothetical protein